MTFTHTRENQGLAEISPIYKKLQKSSVPNEAKEAYTKDAQCCNICIQ